MADRRQRSTLNPAGQADPVAAVPGRIRAARDGSRLRKIPIDPAALWGIPRPSGDVMENARLAFLNAAAEVEPRVLESLRDHADDLAAWAQRWNLPAWAVGFAATTLRMWRHSETVRAFEAAGTEDYARGPQVEGRRGPRAYRDREHFRWLARVIVKGETRYAIAKEAGGGRKVATACARLAKELDIEI